LIVLALNCALARISRDSIFEMNVGFVALAGVYVGRIFMFTSQQSSPFVALVCVCALFERMNMSQDQGIENEQQSESSPSRRGRRRICVSTMRAGGFV
jgi:hypothetical protein